MDKKLHLLLVDDDATDRELFIDAIGSIRNDVVVSEASDGQQALAFLASASILPDLIILDLNMPVKDGRATLSEIKKDDRFKSIPVCIMSTSSAHFDVQYSYDHGASLFLVKPLDFTSLIDMLQSLLTLFRKYVTLVKR